MASRLILPQGYSSVLSLEETQYLIRTIKMTFERELATQLCLYRVSAPLFVEKGTGINDDLSGAEHKVTFDIQDVGTTAEVVNSLAKWKRVKLRDYSIDENYGLYTDMSAIRPDEALDNLHSIYVDQWDWEKHITKQDRTLDFLKKTVKQIYAAMLTTEHFLEQCNDNLTCILPKDITFIHSEELCEKYPDLTPQQRENEAAKLYGAIFVIGIGHKLSDGKKHDERASDYDDWSTYNQDGFRGLNGDIIFWNPVLQRAFEISSMGIRVDETALLYQLEYNDNMDRKDLFFHQQLLTGKLPYSIGGGIGQSRLAMFFLKKAHIGEVQASIWSPNVIDVCKNNGIVLL